MSSHPSPTTPSNPSPATPSHPRPLTLGSLVRHVTVQEQRIKPFLGKGKGFHLLDADEDMALLWEAVWGKTDLLIDVTMPVERGPNPVDDASIGEVVPKKCDVMVVPSAVSNCWDIGCEKILIRGEYEEAEQSVVSGSQQPRCHGIMVIGQPGIGKSAFLLRLLLRRLILKLPTALQITPDDAVLFYGGGVGRFEAIANGARYRSLRGIGHSPPDRIWALVDSNKNVEPAEVFLEGRFYIVNALSPRPDRQRWAKNSPVNTFNMDGWSFSEVLQGRHLQQDPPQTEQDLWNFYSELGAPPRSLYRLADRQDHYRKSVKKEVERLSSGELMRLLTSTNDATENSHYVITTRPLEGDRSESYVTFTSLYALENCCKLLLQDGQSALESHYRLLRGGSSSAAAAGKLFETLVHHHLLKQKTITLFPILGYTYKRGKNAGNGIIYGDYNATKNKADQKQINMPNLEEFLVIDETDKGVKLNTYYRPRRANFPSIDSWVLIRPDTEKPHIFIMFQITVSTDVHDLKQEGLDLMDQLVIPGDALRWLVVVTPMEGSPRIGPVMADYLKKKKPAGAPFDINADFPVFHYSAEDIL